MFDFSEINKFRDLINSALDYSQKFSLVPKKDPDQFSEEDFIISDEDFKDIHSNTARLLEGITASESLVLEEMNFNIVSIEGESKGYLYAQKLHETIRQLPTVAIDSVEFFMKHRNKSAIIRIYSDEWCRQNNIRSLPEDSYLLKCARAINAMARPLDTAYNISYRIEEYFKTTYWYVRYPEKFGGTPDPIGYAPILYQSTNSEGLKLQWNCRPAVAGYIISELIRAGYIEPPTRNGDLSFKKLAAICNQIFEVKGHSPSIDSWRNVLDPERNTLPELKRIKLNIPDLDDLI